MSTIYECKQCGGRNTEGGLCILCGASLGSLGVAVVAAVVSTALLGAVWVGISILFRIQILWIAALYGGLVSGAIAHYSGGRGFFYQLIASAATLAGIAISDTAVLWIHWPELALEWNVSPIRLPFWALLPVQLQWDPVTGIFCIIGVFGGLWLWK